jgi:hypothetical protein
VEQGTAGARVATHAYFPAGNDLTLVDTQYCCGAYTPPGLLSLVVVVVVARTTVWLCAPITSSSHTQYPQSAGVRLFQQIQNHLQQNTPAGKQAGMQVPVTTHGEHGENALCLCHSTSDTVTQVSYEGDSTTHSPVDIWSHTWTKEHLIKHGQVMRCEPGRTIPIGVCTGPAQLQAC